MVGKSTVCRVGCFFTPEYPADCATTLLCRMEIGGSEDRREGGGRREEDLDLPASSGCICLVPFVFGVLVLVFEFDLFFLFWFCCWSRSLFVPGREH